MSHLFGHDGHCSSCSEYGGVASIDCPPASCPHPSWARDMLEGNPEQVFCTICGADTLDAQVR